MRLRQLQRPIQLPFRSSAPTQSKPTRRHDERQFWGESERVRHPRTSALRGVPREVRDLVAAARNAWLVCFNNLSHLPNDLADAACRLATGGGFGGRELYSDHDEAVFDATRPLVFNAIPDLGAARPDFLDRSLIIEFHDIRPER